MPKKTSRKKNAYKKAKGAYKIQNPKKHAVAVLGKSGSLAHWGMWDKMNPFGPYKVCTLEWAQTKQYSNGITSTFGAENLYRLNSLFDPDETGVGHQPYSYDTLESLYQSYKVFKVDIKIEVLDPDADGIVVAALMTPVGSGSVLAGNSLGDMHEKPQCLIVDINDSGRQKVIKQKTFTIADLVGVEDQSVRFDNITYSAGTGANPTSVPKLHIACAALDAAAGVGTKSVYVRVTFNFHARFWNRKVLGQSN